MWNFNIILHGAGRERERERERERKERRKKERKKERCVCVSLTRIFLFVPALHLPPLWRIAIQLQINDQIRPRGGLGYTFLFRDHAYEVWERDL